MPNEFPEVHQVTTGVIPEKEGSPVCTAPGTMMVCVAGMVQVGVQAGETGGGWAVGAATTTEREATG